MSLLPFPPRTTSESLALLDQDVGILHAVVHGTETEEVLTDNGLIPSISKFIADTNIRIGQGVEGLQHNSLFYREDANAHPISSITGLTQELSELNYELDSKAGDGDVVKLAGNQTIDGEKTFLTLPTLPLSAPVSDTQAVQKKYVDDAITAALGGASGVDRTLLVPPTTVTEQGRYFIVGNGDVTLPNPTSLPDGQSFDFAVAVGFEPQLVTVTDGIKTKIGLTDTLIMDLSGAELVTNNGKYEV
jgi:hypothetical protein